MTTRSSQEPRRRNGILRMATASMLALALALPNAASAGDPPPLGELDPSLHEEFVAAQQAMKSRQYKDAQVILEGIGNEQPGWTPATYNLGVTLEARGKLWKASGSDRSGTTSSTSLPPDAPDGVGKNVGNVETPASQQLLLVPVGDAEGLLGREVQISDDGGWTLADARAPGCEVRVKQEESQYTRTYSAELKRLPCRAGAAR